MAKVKYPIGIQSFEKLRKNGFLYVDKTRYVYDLASNGTPVFLSRPRRFGKSLLLSTIEAYFQGKKELFDGLEISELEQDWLQYPVIHIDMNNGDFRTPERLEQFLSSEISNLEEIYGSKPTEQGIGERFQGVIQRAYDKTGRGVVVLIDEYDKPMLQVIDQQDQQGAYRDALKPFFGCLKKMDKCIIFIMLTGVTKFGKLSVFSDLNNLEDISLSWEYSDICGINSDELQAYFSEGIERLAQRNRMSMDEAKKELAKRYNGYHFSDNPIGVYNPFGILNSLKQSRFSDYWYQTGTPTFLIKLLFRHNINVSELESVEISEKLLSSVETISSTPIPVIYQSGYLSIKDYDPASRLYTLGFPNQEVRECFLEDILPYYANLGSSTSAFLINEFVNEVNRGEIDAFLRRLQSLLSNCNYQLITECEKHYQNVLYIVFTLMGMRVDVERHTGNGRIDMVVETDKYVYVMEFKYNGTAQDAINQIYDRGYVIPYQSDHRTVYKVGVSFSDKTHTLAESWIVEKYSV